MDGWGRGAYGEGRYGDGKAPLGWRIVILLLLCILSWVGVWGVIYIIVT